MVRLSELLPTRGALEVTSLSTPHKAWGICCDLKEKDEERIRDRFQFPSSIRLRIPNSDNRAYHSYANEVCFYDADFVSCVRNAISIWIIIVVLRFS